ncbi:Uncharacterised protein [Streptococcus suis]|uniref:Uncharacterized protein n=1 Tax=Streptococcus suis TaxID=1307 RepID=A0A0Z8GWA4_STRSU|nr:Uncharacterised protein [Streptococcus suis]
MKTWKNYLLLLAYSALLLASQLLGDGWNLIIPIINK